MKKLFICIIILLLCNISNAQDRFDAAAKVGINLGQIDGDNSGPYNHYGIHAGVASSFSLDKRGRSPWRMVIELNYSHKGSYVKSIDRTINLSYIELPLMMGYSMGNLRGSAGISPAVLIKANVTESGGVYDSQSSKNYLKFDRIPFTTDVKYLMNQNWFISARFQSSLITIANESGTGTYRLFRGNKGQFHRLINLSIGYQF